MGDFEKHLSIAREKLSALVESYEKGRHTVVGDLAIKILEQLIEADAARANRHFGSHQDRQLYSKSNFPSEVLEATRRIWFAYGDLGYDGINGGRAREIVENLNRILEFFGGRFGEKIEPEAEP